MIAIFFGLATEILRIWGHCKGLKNTFPTVYYTPPNPPKQKKIKTAVSKERKKKSVVV
jgi:hypothetical protein